MYILVICALVLFLVYYLYNLNQKNAKYFNDKGIPFITNPSTKSLQIMVKENYDNFPDSKITGFSSFGQAIYIVRDPEMQKKMLIKDFDHFTDHRNVDAPTDSLFGNSLFSLSGQKWRDMRMTLTPAFTGSKIRLMFDLISECGDRMVNHFLDEAKANGRQVHEIKNVFQRFTNDVIATCAFGISVDSLKEKENTFFKMGEKITNFQGVGFIIRAIGNSLFPSLFKALNISMFDAASTKYFRDLILDTMEQRKRNHIVRHDMINLLMQVRKNEIQDTEEDESLNELRKKATKREWTDNEIAAQCFVFFIAGFDSVANLLSFLAYELTVNPDIQEKLYEEVLGVAVQSEGKPVSYEAINQMKYLDMVISETLRKWPPAVVGERICSKDYQYDDGEGLQCKIEEGSQLWVPIYGLHQDPKYFPNPTKFDPERFSDENKHTIQSGTFIPFGVGPRNCIGNRFALMETKTIIYYLLKNFSFEATEKTEIPLIMASSMFGFRAKNGIWLEFKPRV